MFDNLILNMQELLLSVFKQPWIVCAVLATLPIVEARLAIPMAFSYGYGALTPFIIGFVGSTAIAPILLLVFIPLLNLLKKIPIVGKLSDGVYDKIKRNSEKVDKKSGLVKKMLAIVAFVAIPLPLTGVWSGCAVASLCKIGYLKSLIAVSAGNFIASVIVYLLCCFFQDMIINYIITAFGVIALVSIAVLLIKALRPKKSNP